MKYIMHQIINFFIFFCLQIPLLAQVTTSQTYPVLFPRDIHGFRAFPDFELEESLSTLVANECINGELINLQLSDTNEQIVESTVLTSISCDDINLNNQHFLSIEPQTEGYVFTCININLGQAIWQKTYHFPYFLLKDNVLPTLDGGFYCYQPSPFYIRRYNSAGEQIWDKMPISTHLEDASKIIKVVKNGDVYLRTGHLGGNDLMVKISRVSGKTGETIWERDVPTHRNLAQATHITIAEEVSFIIVINNYGAIPTNRGVCGGWDISFLEKENGELFHHFDKTVFGTTDIKAVIHPHHGVYFLESQIIDDRFNDIDSTGFYLYHFNRAGEELWKKTLETDLPFYETSLSYFSSLEEDKLLFLGTRKDSLWRLELKPEGF